MTDDSKDIEPTTDSWIRYAGYTARIKSILFSAKRYMAYSSDFGEAFRPVVNQSFVKAAYAVSWAYVAYDVSVEGYRSYKNGDEREQIGEVVVKRAVFQSLASMALPAFTIHSTVRIFSQVFNKVGRYQKWGPTTAGLLVVPALPFLFDHPVEYAVDAAFDKIKELSTENTNTKKDL